MSSDLISFLPDGRPCLVLTPSDDLLELIEVVDRGDRAAAYAGRMPSPAAGAFVVAGRQVLAIDALVPQAVPGRAIEGSPAARWITTAEAAQLLRISERAVRKRIANGALAAKQLGGRWLIDTKEIPDAAA